LGVLLYQMATGELPFRGATPFELSMEIMVGTPPKLAELPEPLQSVLRRSLEKDPAARTQQVEELANALEGGAQPASEAAPVVESSPVPPALPAPRRWNRWWSAGAAGALCLLLMGGIYARHVWAVRHAVQPYSAAQAVKASRVENPGVTVWVNTDSGTYHCAGTRWYGKTHAGEYMTQKQARDQGYRPAGNRACM
jgi:hypothetical protein